MAKNLSKEAYAEQFASAVKRLSRRRQFTVDDVVELVGDPPQGRNALGGLINGLAKTLGLQKVGRVPSRQDSRRGSSVTAWSRR